MVKIYPINFEKKGEDIAYDLLRTTVWCLLICIVLCISFLLLLYFVIEKNKIISGSDFN